ncbi:acetyl-CoA synthetase-like protein [Cucurbitaria berberidis CBS 394.84]|uniref:Acetyl-CoA synthetase-like protein n=1 Tax=Cucurbitaria berberidis CBS 394.84 TaxID=1168544 RepID=A0A9P4GLL9_9PLEO|nr:acetyl-CoA synthetase-like protein [Cucurbitaria berberidis CBS 394.84]KAF1848608.1 acetyl-CoA synthetase-like protein [Cucurbitaria berberidis CBS 394.84]
MPTKSPFPDVEIPDIDLWGLIFDRKDRDFPDDKVIYRAIDSDRKYTFADVKSCATQFGEGLRNLWDWQKDEVLALYAPNDIDIPPIVYGTLFAGGIVTPANPAYSVEELAYQLENSGAKALVTTKKFLDTALKAAKKVGLANDRVILLGAEKDETHRVKHWSSIRKTSGALRYRRRRAKSEDLAFLAYSSGTTGLPKGVMLTHRNIVADLVQIQGAVGGWYSSSEDKFLGVLPFFHIYGLTGLVHQVLHRGIEIVVMPAFEMEMFLRGIQDHKITFVYVAPPIIVRLSRDKMVDKYNLSSIKMITSGAAPLTKELVETVHKRLNIKVNQAYGLSETSPMTHTQPWNEWYASVGSVGKMFPNMSAKYMSAEGKELGPGEAGELWLSGPNIFKGYWKNEDATKESITDDGFFKTGDIGYQDEQNNFFITDRVKELIKYKGFQVPPAELEGKLMENELVDDVAVIGVNDEQQHTEVPRAYIVASQPKNGDAGKTEASAIVDWMGQKVANHKRLRGGIVFVDEIPRCEKSASGKILRRMLKERSKEDIPLGISLKSKL